VIFLVEQFRDVDGDPLPVEVVDGPTHGVISQSSDGSLTFTPDVAYFGADRIRVRVSDGSAYSELIVVHFVVSATVLGTPPPDSAPDSVAEATMIPPP